MTDTPSFDTIKFEVADHVATIILNRPDRLNSMPPAMADDIRTALDYLPMLGARAADHRRRPRLLFGGGPWRRPQRVGGRRRREQPQGAAQPL
jgi:hypothetical protein